MITVNDILTWPRTGSASQMRPTRRRRVELWTRDVERSMDFYSHLFDFRAADEVLTATRQGIVLRSAAGNELVLRPGPNSTLSGACLTVRWALVVNDLEVARQVVWDSGIRIAHHDGAPDQIYRWKDGRSLYIRGPDGNELELMEASPAVQNVELLRRPDATIPAH